MEQKVKIHANGNKIPFFNVYNDEHSFFCTKSGMFIKKNLSGYTSIKDKISLFHIPDPNLNQKPSKIYVTRKECCRLVGISIEEYLFIDHYMCGLKPIIKCNGKILFKMSITSVIINCTEMWLLHPENATSIEIIEKILDNIGYNRSFDHNTPSTKISFGDNTSREFISPFYGKTQSNSSIELTNNSSSEETQDISSNSLVNSISESNITNQHENKNRNMGNSNIEISKIDIENSTKYLPIFNKTNTHSFSFAAICVDVVLEVFNRELKECINAIREEVINNCNGLIKSSKWYKYPWRFTFADLTKKKLISKSLSVS